MLGRRGQEAAPAGASSSAPTARVPGASVAARAEADRRRALQPLDADGFQPVRGGASAVRQPGAAPVAGEGARAPPRPPVVTRNSWAAMSEEEVDEEEDGDDVDDDAIDVDEGGSAEDVAGPAGQQRSSVPAQHHGGGGEEDGIGGGDVGGEEFLDETDLRRMWTAHCQAVRKLERDPQTPQELLADARAGRDAAEARWRAAKRPHPLVKRIRWADQDLKEAEAKLHQHRLELDHHRTQAAKRTKELEERVAADLARVEKRRAAIEALHAEGAQQRPNWSTDRAAHVAAYGIESDVAPALLAAIERLGSSAGGDKDAIVQELQLVAVPLNRVQGVLQDAADQAKGDGAAQHYDISGDGDEPPPGAEEGELSKPPATPTPQPQMDEAWASRAVEEVGRDNGTRYGFHYVGDICSPALIGGRRGASAEVGAQAGGRINRGLQRWHRRGRQGGRGSACCGGWGCCCLTAKGR